VIFQDPSFGITPPLFRATRAVFDSYPVSALVGWATIVVEATIALSMIGSARKRRLRLALTAMLHSMIILLMGLFSFGLTMIGAVAAAAVLPRGGSGPDIDRQLNTGRGNEERQRARRDPPIRCI
jgi:hypothetical protein